MRDRLGKPFRGPSFGGSVGGECSRDQFGAASIWGHLTDADGPGFRAKLEMLGAGAVQRSP